MRCNSIKSGKEKATKLRSNGMKNTVVIQFNDSLLKNDKYLGDSKIPTSHTDYTNHT
jgi:hypothetical protein